MLSRSNLIYSGFMRIIVSEYAGNEHLKSLVTNILSVTGLAFLSLGAPVRTVLIAEGLMESMPSSFI